jgi:hypothetical protein
MPRNRIVYGAYTWDFVAIHGQVKPPGVTLKEVEQPGVDGVAFKIMGRKSAMAGFALEAVVTSQAGEVALIADMMALQGLPVTIYTATSVYQANFVITKVDPMPAEVTHAAVWKTTALGSDGRVVRFNIEGRYPFGS